MRWLLWRLRAAWHLYYLTREPVVSCWIISKCLHELYEEGCNPYEAAEIEVSYWYD